MAPVVNGREQALSAGLYQSSLTPHAAAVAMLQVNRRRAPGTCGVHRLHTSSTSSPPNFSAFKNNDVKVATNTITNTNTIIIIIVIVIVI
eukprot:760432-Hanusia_phi.AAC.1